MDDVYICSLPVVETIAIEDVSPNPSNPKRLQAPVAKLNSTRPRIVDPRESYHVVPVIIFFISTSFD